MLRAPTDIEPSALFLKLSEAPFPSEVVNFPRRMADGSHEQIRIRVLPMPEHNAVRLEAQQWLTAQKMSPDEMRGPAALEVLGDRIAQELLAKACLSVEPIENSEQTGQPRYVRLFRSSKDLDFLTADELHALFWSYELIQEKYGPSPELMTVDDVNDWMKKLVEGASKLPLSAFTWRRLAEFTTSLAARAYALSAILASQSSSLPPTLASNLETWGIGTTSFGLRHVDPSIISGSELDPGDEVEGPAAPTAGPAPPAPPAEPPPTFEITSERAAALARQMTGHPTDEGP